MNRIVVLALLTILGSLACWRGFAFNGDVSQDLAREAKRRQALEQDDYHSLRRIEAKQLVIAEVVAGRMGLIKAADRFAAINATSAEETVPAPSYIRFADEKACAQSVLSWTRAALAKDPTQASRLLPVLEEEYRQHFDAAPSSAKRPEGTFHE